MQVTLCESPKCKFQVIILIKKLIVALCIKLKKANVGPQDVDIIFNYKTKLKKTIIVCLAKPSNSHTRIVTVFASKLFEPQPIIVLKQFSKLDSNRLPRFLRWSGKKYEIWEAIGSERIPPLVVQLKK